jgi:hypothetical protein
VSGGQPFSIGEISPENYFKIKIKNEMVLQVFNH